MHTGNNSWQLVVTQLVTDCAVCRQWAGLQSWAHISILDFLSYGGFICSECNSIGPSITTVSSVPWQTTAAEFNKLAVQLNHRGYDITKPENQKDDERGLMLFSLSPLSNTSVSTGGQCTNILKAFVISSEAALVFKWHINVARRSAASSAVAVLGCRRLHFWLWDRGKFFPW